MMKRSKDPKIRELAQWFNDSEQAAIDFVLNIIWGGISKDGEITATTADKALKEKERLDKGGQIAPTLPAPETFLDDYRAIIAAIAAPGSSGRALYLQGFLHTADCTSLWLFKGDGVRPSVTIGKEPFLTPELKYDRHNSRYSFCLNSTTKP